MVAEQFEVAGAHSSVATQSGERCVDLGETCACDSERIEVDSGEFVEGRALHGRREETLVRVLTVQIDEAFSDLHELADRRQSAVHVGATAPVDRHDTRHDPFLVTDDETTFDSCFGGAGPDSSGVGTTTHQQVDRLDEHRLAGPGLAGHGDQPRSEDEIESIDHSEVFDVQLDEHVDPYRSARPNLDFKMRWNRSPWTLTKIAG